MRYMVAAITGILLSVGGASAGPVGSERPPGWQTWTWGDQCFAVLFPEKENVPSLQKDGAYLAIKHMPAEETFDSVAVVSGRPAERGLVGRVEIDETSFDMLMFAGTGFVSSGQREEKLLAALSSGKKATVTWTTADTLVVQTYDLSGLARARKIIDYACKETWTKPANPS